MLAVRPQANAFKHAFFESEELSRKLSKKRKVEGVDVTTAEGRANSNVRLNDFEVPPEDVEWQFWNIVKTPDKPVEVLYGSDLDTLQYGSGFPRPRADADPVKGAKPQPEESAARRYAAAPWNLNNLCRLDKCVLAHCNDAISGMVVPWLYVGMLFSSFCWHVEDHFAHSINYMHWGSPKTWRAVQSTSTSSEPPRSVPPFLTRAPAPRGPQVRRARHRGGGLRAGDGRGGARADAVGEGAALQDGHDAAARDGAQGGRARVPPAPAARLVRDHVAARLPRRLLPWPQLRRVVQLRDA